MSKYVLEMDAVNNLGTVYDDPEHVVSVGRAFKLPETTVVSLDTGVALLVVDDPDEIVAALGEAAEHAAIEAAADAPSFIKLTGAWSGEPIYLDPGTIISAGRDPVNPKMTHVLLNTRTYALVSETPDEVMELITEATGIDYVELDTAAYADAVKERAAQKNKEKAE